ncbi:hypothetical protein [Corynebacterium aquilae]|uniref:DivIVA domain-containing protein n=1 Tax=Corynebacterium aquilae DSM 44791 TaxID=1431546 RepID=A0A1L7CF76_9CORY|nr:hypothetical protein [Corynebacterium aquilae]APT84485.1 hypothetical protein CAQU_04760 [Corynebacterium aquilae DSM 44791]
MAIILGIIIVLVAFAITFVLIGFVQRLSAGEVAPYEDTRHTSAQRIQDNAEALATANYDGLSFDITTRGYDTAQVDAVIQGLRAQLAAHATSASAVESTPAVPAMPARSQTPPASTPWGSDDEVKPVDFTVMEETDRPSEN